MSSSVGIYASQISGHLGLATDILVVAGGGGGGADRAGGGGAGGLLGFSAQTLSFGTSNTVTVGAGGPGGVNGVNSNLGVSGNNSQFGSLTAAVGGGANLTNGGSGGGSQGGSGTPGTGTSGQGNSGAGGTGSPNYPAGGGGGAGVAGTAGSGTQAGAGGNGATYNTTVGGSAGPYSFIDAMGAATSTGQLSSTHYYYAGGGGGGVYNGGTGGAGGLGGGGAAPNFSAITNLSTATGTSGTSNTGGGGGGGSTNTSIAYGSGGTGGSGIVITRYAGAQQAYGGTVTTTGGYTYHAFTSSGTFYTALTVPVFGYNLWLDASDSSSITSSSNLISQWNDKSNSANNFTSSGGLRPTYTANSQNGLATVSFTASQGLTTPTFPFGSSAFTVFTVQKINANGLYHGILEQNVLGGVGIGISGASNYFSLFKARISPQDYSGNIGATSSAYDVYVTKSAGMSSGSISATAYKNGTSIGTASFSSGSTANGAAVGYDGNNGDYSNMNLAEILVYPSQLSDADRNKVEAYLRAKWRTV